MIPRHAVVWLGESCVKDAERYRRALVKARGLTFSQTVSIMRGCHGWRIFAAGTAKLSGRPFVDLTRGTS